MSIVLFKARKVTYETWFRNHVKAKKPGKPPIKMGQKWTERSIIDTLQKKELLKKIEDKTGAKPRTKEMMNHYTVHLNRLMASLSLEDLQQAKETADEWNSQGVPDDVKVEIARKKGDDMIRHFSSEMWNHAGMRVFVLSAWKDGESKVQVAGHDYNQEFGGAKSFMKSYNWKVIEPEWDTYATSVFEGDVDENPVARKKGRQDNTYTLDIRDDGSPVIPEYVSMDLDTKKAVVRAFLTWHYRTCCGDPKVSIPWKYVIPRYDKIIPVQYLPEGHNLAEPSKLRQVHATELLRFWYRRQEEGEEHIFEFTGWWDNDSQDIVLATDQDRRVTSRAQPTTQMKKPSGSKSKKHGHHEQSTGGQSSRKKGRNDEPAPAHHSGVKAMKSASSTTPRNKSEGSKNKHKSSDKDIDRIGTTNESSAKPSEQSDDDVPPSRTGRRSKGRKSHMGLPRHRYRASVMSSNDSDSEVEQKLPQKALAPLDKHVKMDMVNNRKARILDISSTDSSTIDDVKQNAKFTVREGSKSGVTRPVIPPACTVGPASQSGGAAPGYQANANRVESASTRTAEPAMSIAHHLTGKEHAKKGGRKCAAEETLEGSPPKRNKGRGIVKQVTKNEIEPVAKRLKKQVAEESMEGSPSKRTWSKTSDCLPTTCARKPNSRYATDYVRT
ncbi:uncharacterized protein F5147DRAFT_652162 [Suillus discolor]|uniref:Uncharacterized protein n=1 Tax=Suillus discolor TaxID=1912936 RepID=A0A9P7JV34_9AGAM|nr:uncharacterized protein F5147DRAFT_652162 [Suillus discolor]KAG2109992.1 hypothetical protein F5147DRAFT_652162 [Suillus discolor]